MKKVIALMIVVVMACTISVTSVAENQNDTQMVEVYRHDCETDTTELVTIEVQTNASGQAYNVGIESPMPYAIIGKSDEREKITSVTSSPYNKILCLELLCDTDGDDVADATYLGTGFMVADDVMLTAGHCIDTIDEKESEYRQRR